VLDDVSANLRNGWEIVLAQKGLESTVKYQQKIKVRKKRHDSENV